MSEPTRSPDAASSPEFGTSGTGKSERTEPGAAFLREYRAELEKRCGVHMDEADASDDEGAHVGFATRRRALAAGLNEAILTLDEMWRTHGKP